MPNTPDIENTTMSVRTFAVCMWIMVGLGISATWIAAASWYGAQSRLERIEKAQEDQRIAQAAAASAGAQLATQMVTLSQQQAALQKRMDDYRPYKWSVIMEKEYNDELQRKNANLSTPDPMEIQRDVLPYTP